MIETKDGKQHTFASLISRDATFEFMRQVWQGCTGKVMADTSSINTVPGDKNRTWSSGSYALDRNGILQMDSGGKKLAEEESDDKFESYILSVDGDNPDEIEPDTDSDYSEDDDEEDDEDNEEEDEEEEEEEEAEEDEDWNGEEEGKLGSDKVVTSDKIEDLDILDTDVGAGGESGDSDSVNVVVVRFRPDSRYVNLGPETHPPTTVPYDYVNQDSEIPLCNETINAPLGIVMNILFGSENTDFHKSFLETHDASEISEYDKFSPAKDDPSNLERNYIYRRALGYSIGPKSTKCEVTETIESLNFNDHIVVLTSTVTPDVPLGNSFSVKTRYCLSWGPQNTTNLQMSYFIKWTGRSWIKSIIEKQSLSGQKSATEDLLVQLKEAIGLETIELKTKKKKKTKKSRKDNKSTPPTSIETKPASEVTGLISNTKVVAASPYSFNDLIRTNIVTVCYFIFSFLVMILILQLRLFKISNENNQLLRHQLLVTSHLVFNAQTGEPLEAKFKERIEKITLNSELWDWVEKQSPNGKKAKHLTLLDKVEFLTSQLQMLYKNEEEGDAPDIYESIESKFNDLKQQAQEFNYQELLNVGALKDAIGELL